MGKAWDVVWGAGDTPPMEGQQELPSELLPKEKDEICLCADFHICRHSESSD